ncbi:MAG: hypothetical protein CMP10_02965 [Zetaproteobacteria bacterium]|nr:hypothetical protein [Pseudobdellovibrionaceae bacterium]
MHKLAVASLWLFSSLNLYAQASYEFDGKKMKLLPFQADNFNRSESLGATLSFLPETVNLTQKQTSVKDQGNRGSCAYFTASALMEFSLRDYYGDDRDINVSEEYLIYRNKGVDGYTAGGDGSRLGLNLRSWQSGGFMLEEDMPYTHSWFSRGLPCESYILDNPRTPDACYSHLGPNNLQRTKIIKPEDFDIEVQPIEPALESVMAELASGQAVTISVPVNQNGWSAKTGVAEHNQDLQEECLLKKDLCGGHTVLLVGYDQNKRELLFKNSWGESWGKSGYGTMSFDFFNTWSYRGGYFTAKTYFVKFDLQNMVVKPKVLEPQYKMTKNYVQDGEEGVLVEMTFRYDAPIGSFYYVSLFAQTMVNSDTAEPDYQAIRKQDKNGKVEFVADKFYRWIRSPSDLVFTEQRPLQLFIPYKDLEQSLGEGKRLFLRPSVYGMNDRKTYEVLYRTYLEL